MTGVSYNRYCLDDVAGAGLQPSLLGRVKTLPLNDPHKSMPDRGFWLFPRATGEVIQLGCSKAWPDVRKVGPAVQERAYAPPNTISRGPVT